MMSVQAIKKPRKTVKPYGRKLSTQQMGVQVSHRIYTQVSEENRLLGNERRYPGYYPGPVQVERGDDHRGKSDAGSHTSAAVDPAKIFGIQLHGISEREKCDDDFRAARKFEVQIWQQTFLGNGVLCQHSRYPGESSEEVHTRTRETGPDDG